MDPSYSALYESQSPSASYHPYSEKKHRPNYPHAPTAARRNERERNRVKLVNMGFSVLRQHVPNGAKNKKMSKVETLRSAVDYIKQLQKLLGETQRSQQENLLHSSIASMSTVASSSSVVSVNSNHVVDCHVHPESGPSSSPHSASSLDTSELGSSERSLEGPVEDDLISFTKWFS